MNKSQLFRTYNLAKAAARRGRLDVARTNRALGLLQRKHRTRPYHTTIRSCDCRDHQIRGRDVGPCYHMIAKQIEYRMDHPLAG